MNILIVSQTFPLNNLDPTAHFMYDFAQGFSKAGHKVNVLLPYHPKLKIETFKNVRVFTYKYIYPRSLHLLGFGRTLENDQQPRWFVYLLTPFLLLFGTISLYKIVKKGNFDVINAHWILPNGFMAAIVSKLTHTPLFITLPGSDVYVAKQNKISYWMAQYAIRKAKRIISNSELLMNELKVTGSAIPYGVQKNTLKHKTNQNVVMATAGRMVEKKGIPLLKKIFPYIETLSDLPYDEFRKKMSYVDLMILFSIRDSKGNLDDGSLTVLEAMAAGCAVITTDLPGNRLLIRNGTDGFLVDPESITDLQKKVKKLNESKSLINKIGSVARKKAAMNFTPQKIARKYIEVFKNYA